MASSFDSNKYFAARAAADQKLREITENSQRKVADLQASSAAVTARANEVQAQKEAYEKSWVGQLGMTPDTFAANRVNDAASLVSGTSRLAGHVLSLPANAAAMGQDVGLFTEKNIKADDLRSAGRAVNETFDLSSIVDQTNRQALATDLGKDFQGSWDKTKEGASSGQYGQMAMGVGELLVGAAKALASNPAGVREYVVENAPQVLVGLAGRAGMAAMTAHNLGYATDTYSEGIENYVKQHGVLPPEGEMQVMALKALSLAGAEQIGDVATLGAGRVMKSLKGAAKAAEETADDVLRTGFKSALLGVGKAGARGAAAEAPTEGYQTYMEGDITGKPASALDIYTGAAIGAASGGVLASGVQTLAQATGATPEHAKQAERELKQAEKIATAITSGDVSAMVDPAQPGYAPDRAIAALFGNSQKEDSTPEQKTANLEKANQILAELQEQHSNAEAMVEKTTAAGFQKEIAKYEAMLADPANAENKPVLEQLIQLERDGLASLEKDGISKGDIASRKAKVEGFARQLETATQAHARLTELVNGPADVDSLVKVLSVAPVNAQESEQQVAASAAIITLAMSSPGKLKPEVAKQLADDTANSLSPEQRTYLRAFSAARVAHNAAQSREGVKNEILNGSAKNKGLKQHRAAISLAIATGKRETATKALALLRNFATDHVSKAKAAQAAAPTKAQIRSDGNRNWSVNTGPLVEGQAARKEGALVIHSTKLLGDIVAEAQVLRTAYLELKAAYDLKFSPTAAKNAPVTDGAANVQDPTQQGSRADPQPETAAVQDPTPTGEVRGESDASVVSSQAEVAADPEIEKALREATRAYKRAANKNPVSLWSLVKGKLSESTLFDIYGTEWKKRFTALKGKPGAQLDGLIVDGTLDEFLPFDLRFGQGEQDPDVLSTAEEYIKDKLRNQDYLTEETKLAMAQLQLTIDQLEAALTIEDINEAIDQTNQELDAQKSSDEEAVQTASETSDGSSTESTAATEDQVTAKTVDSGASGSSVISATAEAQLKGTTERQAPRPSNNEVIPDDVVNTETPVTSAGQLAALDDKSPAGTEFKQRGFGDFFTQQLHREGDATSRPLVAVKDFLSLLNQGAGNALQFLQLKQLDPAQQAVIELFAKAASSWNSVIKANLFKSTKAGQELYRYNDVMQYLVQGDDKGLDIESNVKTAISYAAFSWIAENGTRPRYNNDEEINAILDRDDNTLVTQDERNALRHVGTRQNVVVNALGQRIIDALGITALENVPSNMLPNLIAGLGAHAFKLLMDRGVIQREEISAERMAELMGETGPVTNQTEHQFVSLVYSEDNKLDRRAEVIVQAMRGTQAVLDKLFSVESGMKEPSFEQIPFTQTRIRNSDRKVPKKLAKILEQANATPFFVRQDMWHLMGQISDEVMLEIAGAEHLEGKHKATKGSVEAANESLIRELDNFRDFVTKMAGADKLNAGLYFEHISWKQQRVGIATNVINPQSSKLHRHLLYRQAWDTEVDAADAAQLENFQLRVAEGLGVKTDKRSNESSLAEFNQLFSGEKGPALNQAVDVLVKTLKGEALTEAEQATLLTGVKAGGEKMHSLDALMALAQQRFAEANGKTTFKTQLMGEVDGVTNGPMLSHFLLGAASSVKSLFGLLNRGGFFENGNVHTQYNLWREAQGNFDLYETTAGHMTRAVVELIDNGVFNKDGKKIFSSAEVKQITSAIYAFTGELVKDDKVTKDGRNIVKTPLTAMVFGSSTAKAVESMANNFIESIYTGIEDVAAGSKDRIEMLAHINTLLRMSKQAQLPTTMSTEQLMEFQFNTSQIDGIKRTFKNTVGKAVKSTMEQDFAAFIEQRRQLNQTAQFAFTLYNTVYTSLRTELIKELIEKGEIATRDVYPKDEKGKAMKHLPTYKEAIHDLTQQQEAELRKRLIKAAPVMHTLMSKQGGSLAEGLSIAKSNRKLSQDLVYSNEVKFGTKFEDNKAGSTRTHAYERNQRDPGVAMAPMSIHSLDSFISHMAAVASKMGVLNIHDAHGAGLANFTAVAQNLNQATWQALLEYSPATEMSDALSRTIRGLAEFARQGGFKGAAVQNLVTELSTIAAKAELASDNVIEVMLQDAKVAAHRADKVKLEAMIQMATIDQYALEGGNYTVTESDRAAAQAKLDALTDTLTADEAAAVKVLQDLLAEAGTAQPAKADAQTETTQPIEQDSTLADADVLNLPATHAMQLVEYIAEDTSVSEDIRNRMKNVAAVILKAKKSLKEAVLLSARGVQAAELVQLISERYNSIPKNLFWGRGEPTVQPHPSLVKFFEANPEVSAKRILEGLFRLYDKDTTLPNREFNKTLLNQLYKVVDPELKVRYVTSATTEDMVIGIPDVSGARGWYSSRAEGNKEIYVLSPEFKHSGLTPEVLVHELVHSAVAYTIALELAKAKKDPSYKSDALALVQDLETLREKAKEFAAKNKLTQYDAALNDVQEFVAWGMTNQGFQNDVLSRITMQSKTRKNVLVTGLQEFIKSVVGIFFKDAGKSHQAVAVNGMTVLINNVSGLFAQTAAANPKEATQVSMNLAMSSEAAKANTYNTLDIHNALNDGKVDPGFQDHLTILLSALVEKLHGPFGSFKAELMTNQALTPMDVWLKAKTSGTNPFATQLQAAPFPISDQEMFAMEQIEATVLSAIDGSEARTKVAYRQLNELYTEVSAQIKPKDFYAGDWATASPEAKAKATSIHDFIFKIESSASGRSNYLARFAALGLGSQMFNKMLDFETQTDSKKRMRDGKSFAEKLRILVDNMLDFFREKVTHTYRGQKADLKLTALVSQLVDIEARHRARLAHAAASTSPLTDKVEEGVKKTVEGMKSVGEQILSSRWLANSKSKTVQAAANLGRTVMGGRVDQLMSDLASLRDKNFKGRPGVVAGLLGEVKGASDLMKMLLLGRKHNEKLRQNIITNTAKSAMQMFKPGVKITREQKRAITKVFLRTGAHTLLPHLNTAALQNILSDPAALQAEITKLEKQLPKQQVDYYVEQIKALAYYKVTGEATTQVLLTNAHNIARMAGTTTAVPVDVLEQVEPLIAPLVALYAIQYTDAAVVKQAAEVLATENQRSDGNGVEFALQLHQRFEQHSKEQLFDNDPSLMMHGYTAEIYNPYVELAVANPVEGAELMRMGYVRVSPVVPDPHDPDQEPRHLYKLKGAGLPPRVTGAMANFSKQAQGSHKHTGYLNPLNATGVANAAANTTIISKRSPIKRGLNSGINFDPRKVKQRYMVPIVNPAGDIVNWRYMMKEDTKDTVLDRNNDFEKILGAIAGATFDKPVARQDNQTVITALKEQFDADYAKNPHRYMEVGPTSSDSLVRETWALLPDETKGDIAAVWGEGVPFMVRNEDFFLVFGAQKLSAATMFKKANSERHENDLQGVVVPFRELESIGAWEKLLVGSVEGLMTQFARLRYGMSQQAAEDYSRTAAVKIMQGERAWREFVHEAKDNIVVKTGVVLAGNIMSNVTLNYLDGVPLKDIIHNSIVGMKGAIAYQTDTQELAHWQSLLDSGYAQNQGPELVADLQRKIKRLQDSIARNPVTKLIEAGLMPTIVEDVEMNDDVFSYRSQLTEKVDAFTAKLNPTVRNIGKQVYMSHDTGLYQTLARATTLSDFVARYVLYQHLTKRKKNQMGHEEAVLRASDAFVNYDIPMQPGIQYLDDMGAIMFTKYFLRMQKPLMRTMKENPARALTMVLFNNYLGWGETVLDSSAFTRIGNNPLESGAFKAFSSFDDIMTMQTGLALLK